MQQAQPPQPRPPCPVSTDVGQKEAVRVSHHDVGDASPSIHQDPHLAPDLPGDLRHEVRQLGGDHLSGRHLPPADAFEGLDLLGLQPGGVAVDACADELPPTMAPDRGASPRGSIEGCSPWAQPMGGRIGALGWAPRRLPKWACGVRRFGSLCRTAPNTLKLNDNDDKRFLAIEGADPGSLVHSLWPVLCGRVGESDGQRPATPSGSGIVLDGLKLLPV